MNIKRRLYSSKYHQQGAATLLVTVVMLVLLTISALTISSLTNTELKVSSNLNRAKEAFFNAQTGLEVGELIYVNDSTATSCDGHLSLSGLDSSINCVITSDGAVTGLASSADGSANATVQEKITISTAPNYGTVVPVLATGDIPTGGTVSLVANPNGGGSGVPVSAWSDTADKNGFASWQTCQYDEFINLGDGDSCPSDGLLCADVSEEDCDDFAIGGCIADPFESIFGVEIIDECTGSLRDDVSIVQKLKDSYYIGDSEEFNCDDLGDEAAINAARSKSIATGLGGLPVIWFSASSCTLPNNPVGSPENPVILIIEGDVASNSNNVEVNGILFSMTDKYLGSGTPESNLDITGGHFNGALLTNGNISKLGGGAVIAYSPDILSKLDEISSDGVGIVRQPGTWKDF